MEGRARIPGQEHGDFTNEAVRGLRALAGYPGEPILLGYHPIARVNPYQDLLYHRAWEHGIAPVWIIRPERLPELTELVRRGITGVLHLHWLNLVLGEAGTPTEARKEADRFLRALDGFKALGGRLVWTVHNVLPHGSRFDDEEARLQAGVVERCDVVHVMTPRTAEHVAPVFRIPAEKTLLVEHPSYLGAYEDFTSRAQARHDLGLMPDEQVTLVLGAIRPYKGLDTLLDAWERLGASRPRRLVIAGNPSEEPGVAAVIERAALDPSMLVHARPIPPTEIQTFLRAADVMALPYVRSLNSGAQMLALTFGLPVIVPSGGGLDEIADERFARTFAPGDTDALAHVLNDVDALATPVAREAALAEARRRAPAIISERFARELRARLGLGGDAPVASAAGATDGPAPDPAAELASSTSISG